jgi:hypothetical protein
VHAHFWCSLANGDHSQNLCLGLVGEDCTTIVVLQTGDSCSSIATAADIPVSTLLANNPNINADCTNIYPGEVRVDHMVRVQILILLQVLCVASEIFNYD